MGCLSLKQGCPKRAGLRQGRSRGSSGRALRCVGTQTLTVLRKAHPYRCGDAPHNVRQDGFSSRIILPVCPFTNLGI
jgi:hypothetical protein